MSLVNNKETKTTWIALLACLYWLPWTSPHPLNLRLWGGIFSYVPASGVVLKRDKSFNFTVYMARNQIYFLKVINCKIWPIINGPKCLFHILSMSFEFLRILYFLLNLVNWSNPSFCRNFLSTWKPERSIEKTKWGKFVNSLSGHRNPYNLIFFGKLIMILRQPMVTKFVKSMKQINSLEKI